MSKKKFLFQRGQGVFLLAAASWRLEAAQILAASVTSVRSDHMRIYCEGISADKTDVLHAMKVSLSGHHGGVGFKVFASREDAEAFLFRRRMEGRLFECFEAAVKMRGTVGGVPMHGDCLSELEATLTKFGYIFKS